MRNPSITNHVADPRHDFRARPRLTERSSELTCGRTDFLRGLCGESCLFRSHSRSLANPLSGRDSRIPLRKRLRRGIKCREPCREPLVYRGGRF